ncbi:MAG: hypothetical protein LBJ84_05705, partial [Oscillospiraceae bacterium]|nr:hypothetical protein [Oscillospiraceae bacterium]
EIILMEFDAQLDKLTRAGFHISYVDSHMLPEIYVPGLHEEMARWAERRGLLDHMYFYNLHDGWKNAAESGEIISYLRKLPEGQYFFLTHPAVYSEEMLQTGNAEVSGESVAQGRGKEAKIFGNPLTTLTLKSLGVTPLRYDEAKPLKKRLTVEEVRRIMG